MKEDGFRALRRYSATLQITLPMSLTFSRRTIHRRFDTFLSRTLIPTFPNTPLNLILPFLGKRRRCIGRGKFGTLKDHIRKSTGKVKIVAYVYKKSVPNGKSRVRKQTLLGSKFESGEMNRYSLAKSVNIYRKIFYILRYCKGLMPYLFLNK